MQGGAGPPFRNPPSLRDLGSAFGASLRAGMPGLAISGRRTQTPGRSPCFRATPRLPLPPRGGGWVGGIRPPFTSSWCLQAWVADVIETPRSPAGSRLALYGALAIVWLLGGLALVAATRLAGGVPHANVLWWPFTALRSLNL